MPNEIPFHDIEFLHLLMEAMPHMLFVVDSDMCVFHVNSAASRKLALDSQEVYMHRGGEVLRCLHATDDEKGCGHGAACHECVVRASVSNALANNVVLHESTTMDLITPQGSTKVHFQLTASPFTYEGKCFALLVMEDTTELKTATVELKRLNDLLTHQAMTDPLTGIANRLKFSEALHAEIHRARRYGDPLSLIMFDIDYFKKINDTYGHQAGDLVLREITALVAKNTRIHDLFARWGGEEFLIMVTNNTRDNAGLFAEKLRSMIGSYDFSGVGRVTCSFGVAQLTGDENEDQLAERADHALYRAKAAGRNRVERA